MQDHAGDEDLDMLPCYSPEIFSACFGISSLTKFGWWKIGLWTPWDVSPLDGLSWIITNHHVYLVRICANPTWMVCRMPPCTMVLRPLNPKASRLGGLVALLACVPRKSTTARAGRVVTRAATEDEGLQTGFSIRDESWGFRKWWRRLKDLKEPDRIFGGLKMFWSLWM